MRISLKPLLNFSVTLFLVFTSTSALQAKTINIDTPLYKTKVLESKITTPPPPGSCCLFEIKVILQEFLGTKPFLATEYSRQIAQPETLTGKEIELQWYTAKKEVSWIIPGETVYLFLGESPKGLYESLGISKEDPRPGDPSANFEVEITNQNTQIYPKQHLNYTLTYKNTGGFILEDVRIELMLIPYIQPLSLSPNPDSFGDQKTPFIWRLDKVNPQTQGQISFSLVAPAELSYPEEFKLDSETDLGQSLPQVKIFFADVLVYQSGQLIASASDGDDFISKEAALFLKMDVEKALSRQEITLLIEIAFLFGMGMVLEAYLLIRNRFNLPLFLGCILLIPICIAAFFWETQNLGFSLIAAFFIFGFGIALAFKKEILPEIDELVLLSLTITYWYLLTVTFKNSPTIRNYFMAVAILPTIWIIINGFLTRQLMTLEKILLYVWHLILNMHFIIFFTLPFLGQSTLAAYQLVILGMNSLYYLVNLFYFSELIPLFHMRERQSLRSHLQEWKKNLRFVAERFSRQQIKPAFTFFLLLLQGGVFVFNFFLGVVPDFILLNFAFLIPQALSQVIKETSKKIPESYFFNKKL